jgi:hypothetical protein
MVDSHMEGLSALFSFGADFCAIKTRH